MDLSRTRIGLCAWSAVLLTSGCLPDPPAYDACSGDDSEYYVVAPKGCNGHELVNLFVAESEHPTSLVTSPNQRIAALSQLATTLELEGEFLYWLAPNRSLLQTHTRKKTHVVLYRGSGVATAVIGLSRERHELYVADIELATAPDGSERVTSRIIAFDLTSPLIGRLPADGANGPLPGYARVAAELADVTLTRVATAGNHFYFTSGATSTLRRGNLGEQGATRTSDLDVVVAGSVVDFRLTTPHELHHISFDSSGFAEPSVMSLKRLDLDSGKTDVLVALAGTTGNIRLSSRAGALYLFKCDSTPNTCNWSRVDGANPPVVVADNLSMLGLDTPIVADARGVFVIGSPMERTMDPPRLLDYAAAVTTPSLLAAPVISITPMELDEEFIFVQSSYSYETTDAAGTYTAVDTTRLLRIRR